MQDREIGSMNMEELKSTCLRLQEELADLQVLYDNNLEHGTSLENELVRQNRDMETLQNKMRKYLSPQLYQSLLGGFTEASTKAHHRKKLAVYFSDIVGFSDLTDSLEPELLSEILNSYLTRMSEIALDFGGTVDKFIGDAILVFFGDPEYVDDTTHMSQCIRMALRMREELFRLREIWKIKGINRTLQVRAGINIGYCTVGNFGSENRMDYTIIGGQVNLASRLQSAASPDAIYVSQAAWTLVSSQVEGRFIGPITVKGIHAPVETWELLGLKTRESESGKPRLLSLEGPAMALAPLEMNLDKASDQQIELVKTSLSQALVAISNHQRLKLEADRKNSHE